MDYLTEMATTPASGLPNFGGFIKIWQTEPDTGKSDLLIDKKNTILVTGADLLAQSLAGVPSAKISHMYLRIPLTFPASFMTSTTDYKNNISVFTILLNNSAGYVVGSTAISTGVSRIFEAGLVASFNPSDTTANHPSDKVFARIQFTPITYNSSFNLTTSWGIKFLA
jgi:hypothetical protein